MFPPLILQIAQGFRYPHWRGLNEILIFEAFQFSVTLIVSTERYTTNQKSVKLLSAGSPIFDAIRGYYRTLYCTNHNDSPK